MAYRIDPGAEVLAEVRRIADDEVEDAIGSLERAGEDPIEAVHECRKHCKKLRGLIRLVRPGLGDAYGRANETFRDAASKLSDLRDAQALLQAFDELVATHQQQLPDAGIGGVRRRLQIESDEATARAHRSAATVGEATDLLRSGKALVGKWKFDEDGFDAISGGLGCTYRRGRRALRTVLETRAPSSFHEYRKQVKYTWYHVRLLRKVAPSTLKPLERRLDDLGDLLGDDHDFASLGDRLVADPERYGGDDEVAATMLLIDGQRARLQRQALPLACRLHAERPSAFTDRLGKYWMAWHDIGPEVKDDYSEASPRAGGDLEEQSLEELHRTASALEVHGRSAMHKTDLIGAVRAAGNRK